VKCILLLTGEENRRSEFTCVGETGPKSFVMVTGALSRESRVALPWELYTDNPVVIAETS